MNRYWIEWRAINPDDSPRSLWRAVDDTAVFEDEAEQRSLLAALRERVTRDPYGRPEIQPDQEYRLCRQTVEVLS